MFRCSIPWTIQIIDALPCNFFLKKSREKNISHRHYFIPNPFSSRENTMKSKMVHREWKIVGSFLIRI